MSQPPMNLILGSYCLKYRVWAVADEFKQYLLRCDQGYLLLGEDNYGFEGHASVAFETEDNGFFAFGIEDISQHFAMLLDQKRLHIIFGGSSNVVIVHVPTRSIVARHDTVTMFSQFHDLNALGIDDIFLIETLSSLTAMTYEGHVVWTNDYTWGRKSIRITPTTIMLVLEVEPPYGPSKITLVLDLRTGLEI